MEKSYEKISPTAKLVAYLRTFTDIPYTKEIAQASGAEKTFQGLAGESAESMVRFAFIWEARYKVTDRILREHGITQVLEVAAGLSPRGLAMTMNPDVVYVVTDLPQVLKLEKTIAETILAKSNSHRPNLHFQAANALDIKSLSTAASAFKRGKPIAIIVEGLLTYLNRREKEIIAGNIHELLEKYGGLWVATDVNTKQQLQQRGLLVASDVNTKQVLDEKVQKRLSTIASATGSNVLNNLFSDEKDIELFFGKAGFKIEQYSHLRVLEDLSSVKMLNLNQEEKLKIRQALQTLRTFILTCRT